MKSWPLKLKFGLYSAGLTTFALAAVAGVVMPYIYHHQMAELDAQLAENAEELFRDLENFRGAPVDPRQTVAAKFIPLSLRLRYIELEGPEGQTLYRSPNLRDTDMPHDPKGLHTVQLFGRNVRIGSFRQGPFTLHVGTRLGTIEGMQEDLQDGFLIALPAVAIVVFVGGLVLGRRAVAPVADLTAAAERISTERPEERLPVPASRDEIRRLSIVLNASFDRLQRAYAAAARFSADASHQLKTPVAVLRAGLEELRACDYLQPSERGNVDALHQQTRRLTALIEDLLLLAQADAGRLQLQPAPLDLIPLISVALDDLVAHGSLTGVEVEHELPPALHAMADSRRVALILQNLGENAVKYCSEHGRVRVCAFHEDGMAVVTVANTGVPIAEGERENIFARFHRGAMGENVKGHGLGLNIARELARAHGGDLAVTRSDGEWTGFSLRLPASGITAGEKVK